MTTVFGTHDGQQVTETVLENADARISVLNYGCVIRDWRVDVDGKSLPMVLGFERFEDYPAHSKSFGIIAGRVANRTAKGLINIGGQSYQLSQNERQTHLHGGIGGLGKRLWSMEADGNRAVELTYHSPDGEEGYPGAVDFKVTMTLDGPRLRFEMSGVPDRETPINLAQHNYYNLNGGGSVRDHVLHIPASLVTEVDGDLIPTGRHVPVDGTPYDFRVSVPVGSIDPDRLGIDGNLVLDADHDPRRPAAEMFAPESGVRLKLWTDQPGIQVFDAPRMAIPVPGLDGQNYGEFGGFCLEPQHFPDSLNHPDWPSTLRSPEAPYHQKLTVEIGRD